ncbi:MAG: 5-(carboxyamino)imidazole ribonucleotide synthase [Natronomonas sp.]
MDHTTPAATLGVVGGGQLGRMLGEAAGPLGVDVLVSDPTPECPASSVVKRQFLGDFDDEETIRSLAEDVDVLTYEIELADPDALAAVAAETDTPVHPDPETLRTIQDKLVQTRHFAEAGVPVPEFRRVDDADDLRAAGEELGWPLMLKAREGGYDGRGNMPVSGPEEAAEAVEAIGGPALAEAFVDFECELAVIGVVGADEVKTFPVTETIHRAEILRETVSPARVGEATRTEARAVALDVLESLDGRGVYGIELFAADRGDGTEILLNEVAPRPHNSGHWTIEGCVTSQFEEHVRATLGWPLGDVSRTAPTALANLLGDVDEPEPVALDGVETILEAPRAALHWYGKREARPLRKMGHVTLPAPAGVDPDDRETVETLLEDVRALRDSTTFR